MYLRRKIDTFLAEWKTDEKRKPLMIRGARRVGKTESVLHFAKRNYASIVYINFMDEPKFCSVAENPESVDAIVKNLSLIDPTFRFAPNQTVIILDEIEICPDIAASLKHFREDGKFDVICLGSMSGEQYRQIQKNCVGNKTDYEMFSLDFEEYLWTAGYSDTQISGVLQHMIENDPFSLTERLVYSELFCEYLLVGGMPEAVKAFTESNEDYAETLRIQQQLLLDYYEDIRRFPIERDRDKAMRVYQSVSSQLNKKNRKFMFNKLDKNARAREYTGGVDWLNEVGMVKSAYCLEFPELPLKGNMDGNKFKLYYPDTGLLVATLEESVREEILEKKDVGVNSGMLYENAVAEAFAKQGLGLFYYKKENSTLEEDFFVRTGDELLPVEVRKTDGRSKALSQMIGSEEYADIRHGIKLYDGNIGYANKVYTFPYFCAFKIKEFLLQANVRL